jgi:hypothetical protein
VPPLGTAFSDWSDDRCRTAAVTMSVKAFRSCHHGDYQPPSSCLQTPKKLWRQFDPSVLHQIEAR